MELEYAGELRCELRHGPSGQQFSTDAPLDNGGKGSAFSPTDLLGAALLSCAVTTMGIKAAREHIPLPEVRGRVVKEMTREPPRRIAALTLELELPQGLGPEQRERVIEFARTCPVALSLSPDVEVRWTFR